MHIPRIYLSHPLTANQELTLPEKAFHHVIRVLRHKPGGYLILFNGEGGEFHATLERVDRHTATVRVEKYVDREAESSLKITLAQSIAKGVRMDYSLQKATELGVDRILPLITARSMVNLPKDQLAKRLLHWRKVVISACEQCGRNRVPTILTPINYFDWLHSPCKEDIALMLNPGADKSLTELSPPISSIVLLIGPEGGLTSDETSAAKAAGFIDIRMGPRILRTETAGVAALAALQTLWGDLN